MESYEIIFLKKDDDTEPAKEFILSLDKKMRAKMLRTISILAHNGPELREPYSKFLSDGIFELRAKIGNDITRVLYFFILEHKIVLTNGFIKKSQKTPQNEIERAKDYRNYFLNRKGK